jgi:hypothetical protein
MFVKIPYGTFTGVHKEAGSYHPSVKTQNLAVSAAGPQASKTLSVFSLTPGILLVAIGLFGHLPLAVYVGRLLFTIGIVGLFDFLLSDPVKYEAFRDREREAASRSAEVKAAEAVAGVYGSRSVNPAELRRKLRIHRLQEVELPDGSFVFAPWEFRNSIMGGRHTEEMGGNLSFQECTFLPLTARDYIEAQRITNLLQSRAIQIIQDSEGLNFVGIGLEGGIVASYAREKDDLLPEERALRVAVQAIEECGFVPDRDVCLALDPAASELSHAYREKTGEEDSIRQYLFWRAEDPKVMTTDELVLVDIDRELLQLELDLAVKRGKIDANAPAEEKVQIMQRKANLGMNAVLSLSLALGRLIAARDGKELPDVLRDMERAIDRDYLYCMQAATAAG